MNHKQKELVRFTLMKWKILLLAFTTFFSCRRTYECYAQDEEGITYDTVVCKCYKDVINELEASPYHLQDSLGVIIDTIQINCN